MRQQDARAPKASRTAHPWRADAAACRAARGFAIAADHIYSHWIPLFLVAEYQLKYKEMGIYSALPLLGGVTGGIVGGYLNDWLIRRTGSRRWVRSLVGFAGKFLAAITLATGIVSASSTSTQMAALN